MTNKHAVLVFGRMNPPHLGHSKLIDHALSIQGDHYVVVSHTQDNKTNPLSVKDKLDVLKKMYPKHKDIFSSTSGENPTIFHSLSLLHKAGYHKATVVVGQDRHEEFHGKLHSYNGKFDKSGNGYHFKQLKVVSGGDRDPDAEGVSGISSTKMREAALNNNFGTFRKGLHHNIGDYDGKLIMKKIRQGLGYQGEVNKLREEYVQGHIFKLGDLVETKSGPAEIIYRGSNYLTVVQNGKEFKTWLNEVFEMVDQKSNRAKFEVKEDLTFKGYRIKNFSNELIKKFSPISEDIDTYVLLNCIKCLDYLLSENILTEDYSKVRVNFERTKKYLAKLNLHLSEVEDLEYDLIYRSILENQKVSNVDKRKVALIIANSVNSEIKSTPSETINNACSKFKQGSHSVEAWKLMGRMLNKASDVGIKWNKDIFAPPTRKAMGIE